VQPARLITIPISHFCEKARWVLDATGLDYREERHAPVLHRRATRAVGGKSVPVLIHGSAVMCDSTGIALYADNLAPPERRLVPVEPGERARVLAIEDDLDETVGIDARLLAYWHYLREDETAGAFVGRMMGLRSPVARRVVATLFRALIFRMYRVSEPAARRAEIRVRETFARLGTSLGDAAYLAGDRFTLADLTLAALSAPLLTPPEHPITGRLQGNTSPAPLAALRAELSETLAGRHALRVYRDHRHAGSAGVPLSRSRSSSSSPAS
jgi:glutathione S-transferase